MRGVWREAESDPAAAEEYTATAVVTMATCRERVAQHVRASLSEGWKMERQSKRRGIEVHTLTGDAGSTSYAMKTIGVVNVAPEQFLTTLCDFNCRRQRWEPLMIRGEVVDTEVLRMPFVHRRVKPGEDPSRLSKGGASGVGSAGGAGGKSADAVQDLQDDEAPKAFYYADVPGSKPEENALGVDPPKGADSSKPEAIDPAAAAASVDPRSKYVGKVMMTQRTISATAHGGCCVYSKSVACSS